MTQQHYERFIGLMTMRFGENPSFRNLNYEYAAAFYLMSCDSSLCKKVSEFVRPTGIEFTELLKLSPYIFDFTSQKALMYLAANLFYSKPVKGLDITGIDRLLLSFALDAIQIRVYGPANFIKLDTNFNMGRED